MQAVSREFETLKNTVKFNAPLLAIKFTQVSIQGVPRAPTTLENRSYSSIIISSVPWRNGPGTKSHPVRPWLEAYVQEGEAKRKRRAKTVDGVVSPAPITRDEGRSYHVTSIEFEAKKDSEDFHLLLDGALYGPFTRIRVGPAMNRSPENEQCTFPILLNFPILEMGSLYTSHQSSHCL